MGKITLLLALMLGAMTAEAKNNPAETSLETDCLACHKAQQIPNSLIYRRYLMNYSTKARIEDAMLKYLMRPKKSTSIMPPQFFLKFPMKEALHLEKPSLKRDIKAYIDRYDVKKVLVLEKK